MSPTDKAFLAGLIILVGRGDRNSRPRADVGPSLMEIFSHLLTLAPSFVLGALTASAYRDTSDR